MASWQDIDNARKILNIGEFATLQEIRTAFRRRIKELHPDVGGGRDVSRSLIEAWKLLRRYCENYRFRFTEEEVKRNETPEERLARIYGHDRNWGPGA